MASIGRMQTFIADEILLIIAKPSKVILLTSDGCSFLLRLLFFTIRQLRNDLTSQSADIRQ
ncbi:hypothetical protein ZMTM_14340 [Methyloradius palustris]|uniref:Uncharacterized protein n=1 Tax=Methyloradius palustris TaxID=2778876 RepID=A0A8D5G0M1_9PROT|nr:hypothetical protein ZMTM_14340 [Methyloradius palustris]